MAMSTNDELSTNQPAENVSPLGCADWPSDGGVPTAEEANNSLFDFRNPYNTRKLARAIASQNTPRLAGELSGELSYAYQHGNYDNASIAAILRGLAPIKNYQKIIDLLAPNAGTNEAANILLGAVKTARQFEAEQENNN